MIRYVFAAVLAVCLVGVSTAQDFDYPRLNDLEVKVADMQLELERQGDRISANAIAIEDLKALKTLAPPVATVEPPAVYSAPVATYTPPAVTYSAPQVTYGQPVVTSRVTYSAPTVTYGQPVYSTPRVSYSTGGAVSYSRPTMTRSRTLPMAAAPLRGRLRSVAGGGCYIDANGNQVCPDR